jgi:hypothetical protein
MSIVFVFFCLKSRATINQTKQNIKTLKQKRDARRAEQGHLNNRFNRVRFPPVSIHSFVQKKQNKTINQSIAASVTSNRHLHPYRPTHTRADADELKVLQRACASESERRALRRSARRQVSFRRACLFALCVYICVRVCSRVFL